MDVNSITSAASQVVAASSDPKPAAASPTDALANTNTFLQLLVAQIKNQNPLQPTDGVQFITQLAQFSSLEQLVAIKGEITNLTPLTGNSAPADNQVTNLR